MQGGGRHRAVFFDRDGVLNRSDVRDGKPYAPRRYVDVDVYPEVAPQLSRLRAAGFILVVVTHQPDIGNGLVDPAEVARMNDRLRHELPVADVYCCPHTRSDDCACRKPRPGMLVEAASRFGIALPHSFMVGDRAGDIQAGIAAGCRTVFIDRAYAEETPVGADWNVGSLSDAVNLILTSDQP